MRRMEDTLKVWSVFEQAVAQGKVRNLGVSNCYDPRDFKTIYDNANIKPVVLQNRFYKHRVTGHTGKISTAIIFYNRFW